MDPLLLPPPLPGLPTLGEGLSFCSSACKTPPTPVIVGTTQLRCRAVDNSCKALRRIFHTDHSTQVLYIFFFFWKFTVLLVCFVLCFPFSHHRGIFISTDSSPCECFIHFCSCPLPGESPGSFPGLSQELQILCVRALPARA